VDHFPNSTWHLRVHGPNGFWREFHGNTHDPLPGIRLIPQTNGNLLVKFSSTEQACVTLEDVGYGTAVREIKGRGDFIHQIDLTASHGWYDIRLATGKTTYARFAGHIETGKPSRTDPLMGGER
jgi:phospholipase C